MRHLQSVPVHRALIRAAECVRWARLAPLPRPVLDVGCGDGHFAEMAFAEPLDVGFDITDQGFAEARARLVYHYLVVASAPRMPFPDESFATVVSNCVIEHIPDLDGALQEVARVLQPGGQFIFTTLSEHFPEYLLFPRLLNRLGLRRAASAYGRWFNRISVHYHAYDAEEWARRLSAAGLLIEHREYYLGPEAMALFDLSHYYGAPTLLTRRLTGRWVLVPAKTRFWPPERWLVDLLTRYCEEEPASGAYYFFRCRKPAR